MANGIPNDAAARAQIVFWQQRTTPVSGARIIAIPQGTPPRSDNYLFIQAGRLWAAGPWVPTMQHLAVAAIATALALGAGAGAVTNVGPADNSGAPISDAANPMIAGQAMLPSDTIFANASRSPEHGKFVTALKDSGVAAVLKGKGSFTVFAPTDAAFDALSPHAREALFAPPNRGELARSMRYLIVQGRFDSQTLLKRIGESGGGG